LKLGATTSASTTIANITISATGEVKQGETVLGTVDISTVTGGG
jgi:hypothetical protein